MNSLCSTSIPFRWSTEAAETFEYLKRCFTSAPVLRHPNPDLPFIVEVDASDSGVGAVLSQMLSPNGEIHPCAFFSRRLSPAERNYDVGNRELLAIKLALETWRHHLEGAAHPFQVWTDHKNLEYLRSAKRLNPRQSRWALFFDRFNFKISFRPGKLNVAADALSRQFSSNDAEQTVNYILPPTVFSALQDPDDESDYILSPTAFDDMEPLTPPTLFAALECPDIESLILSAQKLQPDPRPTPNDKLFVPEAVRSQVLEWAHSSRLFGHPGVNRCLASVRSRFWWPSISRDTRSFVASCSVCALNKTSTRPPAGLLHPLPIPGRPWSHIAIDFVSGLPSSHGKTVILTVIDRFSKACHLIALPKFPTSKQTADALMIHVFRLHGLPSDIVSDRGPQFTSQVWKSFCKALNCTVSLSSGFHPQSNGQNERLNQEIEVTLRCFTSSNPTAWSLFLPWVEYAHNTLINSSTGLSPFMCSLGYQPPLLSNEEKQIAVPSVNAHIERCQRIWQRTRTSLINASKRSKLQADRRRSATPSYYPGQLVLLSTRNLKLKGERRKLTARFTGPFKISSIINPTAVRLELPTEMRCHPVFHVSQIKQWNPPALTPTPPDPDEPVHPNLSLTTSATTSSASEPSSTFIPNADALESTESPVFDTPTPDDNQDIVPQNPTVVSDDDSHLGSSITASSPSNIGSPTPAPTPPQSSDPGQIRRLLSVRRRRRDLEYLVEHRDKGSLESLWIPRAQVPPQLLLEFDISRSTTRMGTRGRVRRGGGTVKDDVTPN